MYATVDELEDEGYPDGNEDRATAALTLASSYIDRVTGQWFEERSLVLEFDGEGQQILYMPAPIIEITLIEIDDEAIDTDEYTAYDRTVPDDRRNPRIVFESALTEGKRNVVVTGKFGFLESGVTPIEIKRTCLKLALREAALMTDASRGDEITRGRMTSETTDGHSITLGALAATGGPSGDPEVDSVLVAFRRPAIVRSL